jgi:hypothetical protein
MTTDRTLDRLIEAYLAPGVDELPDRSYAAVRTATERTRQRVGLGPWGAPAIRPRPRWVLVMAAVALLAAIALGPGAGGSRKPTATPAPSVPAAPRPLPSGISAYPGTPLEPGTYLTGFGNWPGYHRMQLTVPAGWYAGDGLVFNGPNDGYGMTVMIEYHQWLVRVNADACHWAGQFWQPMTTAQQLVDALANQPGMEVTAPRAVSLGGTPATLVEISIPPDFDRYACDSFRLYFLDRNYGPVEYPAMPSHTVRYYVIDTDRPAIVVAHLFGADATAQDAAALQAVVDSIRFEP